VVTRDRDSSILHRKKVNRDSRTTIFVDSRAKLPTIDVGPKCRAGLDVFPNLSGAFIIPNEVYRMHPPRPRWIAPLVSCVVLLAVSAGQARAQSFVWIGGGTNGDWSNPSNWTPGIPASSATTAITFAGGNNLSTNQNIANPFDLNSLTFDVSAGPFVINSGALRFLANGATAPLISVDTASPITINSPVIFNATGSVGGTGTGTLTFGPLTVAQGTLTLGRGGVTAGNLTLGATGATAAPILSTGANTLNLTGNITYNPNANIQPAGTVNGLLALSAGNHTITGTNSGSDFYSLVLNANMSGPGGITIQDTAGGNSPNIILRGANTYAGPTILNNPNSIVFAGATNTLPNTTDLQLLPNSFLSLNPVTAQPGVTTGSFNQTVGTLTGPESAQIALGTATLTVGTTNANSAFTGSIGGAGGSLTKVGTGALTLGGSTASYSGSFYSGTTTVSGGTLLANNTVPATSATGTSNIVVQNTATLGGIGRIVPNQAGLGGTVVVQPGGTISPGSPPTSIGTLTIGDPIAPATVTIDGTYAADIGAGSLSDLLAISGPLNLGPASVLTLSGTASGNPYTLANYTSRSGTFATVNNLPPGYLLVYGPTSLQLVPEPAMILALCAAAGGVVARRRRGSAVRGCRSAIHYS
jgi:fibronectin-binding autotransporter adhesin